MLKIESTAPKDGGDWALTCDTCRSAASAVYCRANLASRIHAPNQAASLHERVWVCQSCERAPAVFLCKADSASLCAACDSDIHSANPLARRHHRVPIQPIPCTIYAPISANPVGLTIRRSGEAEDQEFLNHEVDENGEDDDEAASWLLLNPIKNGDDEQSNDDNGPSLFGGEVDEYLDLVDYNSCQNNQFNERYNNQHRHYSAPQSSYGGDSVVPILYQKGKNQVQHHCFLLGLEAGKSYPASMSQNVSISSMDVGVVPESTSEVSISHTRLPRGTVDLFSSTPIQVPTQLTPMDRQARVLRYKEKKKNRKFEKTIRYASRKAYAETRPRIKGRFAKRRDTEVEVDQMFSTSKMPESAYSVIPSF